MIATLSRPAASPARKFLTALSALAIALAGMTAAAMPARANTDDVARTIIGLSAIYLFGRAISDANRDYYAPPPPPVYYHPPRPVYPVHPAPPVYHPRPPVHNVNLPQQCQIVIGRGDVYYGKPCLRQYGLASRLPDRCERVMRTPQGTRTVYEAGCLRGAGFVVGRNW